MVKKIISIIMSSFFCLITCISGANAFLKSSNNTCNAFIIGDCNIQLIDNNEETLLGPGETADYSVELKNIGQVSAYVYLVIEDPLYSSGDTFNTKDLKISAYAIQKGYNSCTDANTTWNSYFNAAETFGESVTNSDKIPVFGFLYNGTEGINNSKWTQMSTYQTENSYFYIYKYADEILNPGENSGVIFDQITVSKEIGNSTDCTITPYTFFFTYTDITDFVEIETTGALSCFDVWNYDGQDEQSPEDITYMGKIDDVLCVVTVDDDGNITKYPSISPEYYMLNYLCDGEDEELVEAGVDDSQTQYLAVLDENGDVILDDDGVPDEYYYLGVLWEGKTFHQEQVTFSEIKKIGYSTGYWVNKDISVVNGESLYAISKYSDIYDILDGILSDDTHILSEGTTITLTDNIIYYMFFN